MLFLNERDLALADRLMAYLELLYKFKTAGQKVDREINDVMERINSAYDIGLERTPDEIANELNLRFGAKLFRTGLKVSGEHLTAEITISSKRADDYETKNINIEEGTLIIIVPPEKSNKTKL